MGGTVLVRCESGQVIPHSLPLPPGLAQRIAKGEAAILADEPTPTVVGEAGPEVDGLPSGSLMAPDGGSPVTVEVGDQGGTVVVPVPDSESVGSSVSGTVNVTPEEPQAPRARKPRQRKSSGG